MRTHLHALCQLLNLRHNIHLNLPACGKSKAKAVAWINQVHASVELQLHLSSYPIGIGVISPEVTQPEQLTTHPHLLSTLSMREAMHTLPFTPGYQESP
jgi:hypothetical protein